jgi:hypothetical protein
VTVSNTPFLRLDVAPDDGSCQLPPAGSDMCDSGPCTRQGSTLTLATGGTNGWVRFQVTAETPLWARLDTVEIYVNQTFDPISLGDRTVLSPTACFSTLDTPAQNCQNASGGFGGAPFVEETDVSQRVVASGCMDLTQVPGRDGARGPDTYLLARAYGTGGLFPVVPSGMPDSVDPRMLVDPANVPAAGPFPMAVTSAVLVDVDGDGWKAPFAP